MKKLIIPFILLPFCLLSQANTDSKNLLTVNDGLSQGMIFDILQSRDGFMWIATKDGLNRYDGYRFEVFAPDLFDPFTIASSEVRHLFEDSRGLIWISLPKKMDIFDPVSRRFFHVPIKIQSEHPDQSGLIHLFAETQDGSVWFIDKDRLWKIEVPPGMLKNAEKAGNAYPKLPCKTIELKSITNSSGIAPIINTIFFTKKRKLLLGTDHGLFEIDPTTGQVLHHAFQGTFIKIAGEDKAGQIWLQVFITAIAKDQQENDLQQLNINESGLWIWKDSLSPPKRAGDIPNIFCRFDHNGYLWDFGINMLRQWQPEIFASHGKPTFEWTSSEPFVQNLNFFYTCLFIDHSGIAWMGTNGYGIVKTSPEKPKFISYLEGSSERTLTEDPQGNLFRLVDPQKLYTSKRFDEHQSNPWISNLQGQAWLFEMKFDPTGNCWTNNSKNVLYRTDALTKKTTSFPWKGMGLLYCKNGKLLSVHEEGLLQFDPMTGQNKLFPFDTPRKLPSNAGFSQYFYEDSEGIVWIFCFDGLISATPSNTGYRYAYFKNNPADRTSLSNNFVLCVTEDPLEPKRFLWVGTKGGGLNRLDKQTGKFKHFKKLQGLPNDVVYGILSDDSGHIWMSTNKGLCRFHVRAETIKNFTFADGLQNNEFNQSSYLKMKDGTLIFGGVNGLTVFHPDSLRFNEHVPQTHIVGVKINNEPFVFRENKNWKPGKSGGPASTSPILLTYRQNLVAFEFAALEFSNPSQNQYRYQLIRSSIFGKETEEEWIALGQKNTVQFANLSPGSYTFRVMGSNNDGIWSKVPDELRFVIRPPWWASWWAYLLYVAAATAGVWLFYRYRLHLRLEHQEALRLREMDDFKNRFFTNITHEFRTPLTVILGNMEMMKLEIEKSIPPLSIYQFLISKISITRRNAENLLRLINQILDLAKLESNTLKINYVQGDVLPYLRYISESLHSLANAQNLMLRVESNSPEIVMDYDPERLLQIVYNLLSNALKFTPSGGRVTLRADLAGLDLPGFKNLPGLNLPGLRLTVTDTGAGIPPDELPHIFDRFYQANNLEKAKAGGTGIGLALTKELVHAMGGEISVESELGKGTTFAVQLPVTNKAPEVADKEIYLKTAPPPVFHPETSIVQRDQVAQNPVILIIEDNPDVVEYLRDCLRESYRLDFAYNGRSGIEKALEIVPDLIVSDVMMPEKDGFEVLEILKNDERTSHIPIILLTAKADVESRIKGLRRGADAYLSKPFHREELMVTLTNLFELRRKLQLKYQEAGLRAVSSNAINVQVIPTADPENEFLSKLRGIIEEHLSDAGLDVETICRKAGMGRTNLHNKLSALTGLSITIYVRKLRLQRAKELLTSSSLNISEIAYEVGFNDPKFFSRVFTEEFGQSPSEVKKY